MRRCRAFGWSATKDHLKKYVDYFTNYLIICLISKMSENGETCQSVQDNVFKSLVYCHRGKKAGNVHFKKLESDSNRWSKYLAIHLIVYTESINRCSSDFNI